MVDKDDSSKEVKKMTKPYMRKKRKLSIIKSEKKSYIINKRFKNLFSVYKRDFKYSKDKSLLDINFKKYFSILTIMEKMNIFHKNKVNRLRSKASKQFNSLLKNYI